MIVIICAKYKKNPSRTVDATKQTQMTLKIKVEVMGHHMRHTLLCYWSFVPNMERIHPELYMLQSGHGMWDGWMDGRIETNIPPKTLLCGGYNDN